MSYLKSCQVAKTFETTPEKISKLAKMIEIQHLYTFKKTPMNGSYLFTKKDLEILKVYQELLEFFPEKEMLKEMFLYEVSRRGIAIKPDGKKPSWDKFLKNAKYFQKK